MRNSIERQMREAGRPEPPAALRAHVLAAAMPLVRRRSNALDRIWFSRAWRMTAAAVILGLVAADVAMRRPSANVAVSSAAAAETA